MEATTPSTVAVCICTLLTKRFEAISCLKERKILNFWRANLIYIYSRSIHHSIIPFWHPLIKIWYPLEVINNLWSRTFSVANLWSKIFRIFIIENYAQLETQNFLLYVRCLSSLEETKHLINTYIGQVDIVKLETKMESNSCKR